MTCTTCGPTGARRDSRCPSLRGSPRLENTAKAQARGTTRCPRDGHDADTTGSSPRRTCRAMPCTQSGWVSSRTHGRERTTVSGRRFRFQSLRCCRHPDTCLRDQHITFSVARPARTPNSKNYPPSVTTPRIFRRRRLARLPGSEPPLAEHLSPPFLSRLRVRAVAMRAKCVLRRRQPDRLREKRFQEPDGVYSLSPEVMPHGLVASPPNEESARAGDSGGPAGGNGVQRSRTRCKQITARREGFAVMRANL